MFDRIGKWQIPPRRVVLWHTLAAVPLACVVVLGAFLTYQYHEQSIASRAGVDRAYDVLSSVHGLFTLVDDAEVGELNYVISGDEAALMPLLSALTRVGPCAARAAALVADDPEQAKRIAALEAGIATKLQALGKTVELRRTQGPQAARAQMALDRQGEATDRLRALASEIIRAEYQLLQRRRQASLAHEQTFLRIGIAIAGLSVVTRLLVALGVRWMSKRQNKSPLES